MKKENRIFSIKTKMYIFVVVTVIAVAFGTSAIAFVMGVGQIDNYYKQATSDNARNVASSVDGDFLAELRPIIESDDYQKLREQAEEDEDEQAVEDYLKDKGVWEKYSETRKYISNYLSNMKDMKYIYIVAHGDKDAKLDMYLISDDSAPLTETGYYEERESELLGMDLTKLPEPTISNGDWGWLCSDFKPVYDSAGNCVCIVGCDYAMNKVMQERRELLIYLIAGSLVFTVIVLTGAVLFINKVIVNPLHMMTKEMKKFTPKTNSNYEEAGVIDLGIDSRDEIGEIYQGIRTMQISTLDHLNDLLSLQEDKLKAEKDIEDKNRQIGQLSIETYKDALTGVGNKAAYIKKAEELNQSLREEPTEFALVMIDVNNLKFINDEYGHKSGDMYIKGCCRMICEAFKHSPVYRIGGDEFIVILQGSDYENRKLITEKLKSDFQKSYAYTDTDQWLRYSAAVGMADNGSGDNVDFVFKRADKSMYEDKLRFKQEHGRYR